MAGCENPSVKPKCSRCRPSRAAGCAWASSSPLSCAPSARSQRPGLDIERIGALRVHDEEDLEVAQLVVPRAGVVAQALGARRHAVAQIGREAVEDPRRQLESREGAVGQRDVERRVGAPGPLLLGGHRVRERGQEGARGARLTDAREEVAGEAEALPVAADDPALQVGDVDHQARQAAWSAASSRTGVCAASAATRSRSASASPTSSTLACGEPTTENPALQLARPRPAHDLGRIVGAGPERAMGQHGFELTRGGHQPRLDGPVVVGGQQDVVARAPAKAARRRA